MPDHNYHERLWQVFNQLRASGLPTRSLTSLFLNPIGIQLLQMVDSPCCRRFLCTVSKAHVFGTGGMEIRTDPISTHNTQNQKGSIGPSRRKRRPDFLVLKSFGTAIRQFPANRSYLCCLAGPTVCAISVSVINGFQGRIVPQNTGLHHNLKPNPLTRVTEFWEDAPRDVQSVLHPFSE